MKIKKPLKDFRLKRNIHAHITPDFFFKYRLSEFGFYFID